MAEGRGTESEREATGGEQATVLVVDDEEAVRESFSVYLSSEGYEVRTAETGADALAAAGESVDVVLLDRRLPDRDGESVLAELRARNVDCQIALVTAVQPDFGMVQIDCDDYLVKPVDREDLLATVERLVLLDEYSDAQRELSNLRVKRNVLEVEKHPDALAESEEFRKLQSRIADLEAELDDLEDEFDDQLGYEA